MGANESVLENPQGQGFIHANTNQLVEFHSKNQWKAHFDANKATDKLMVVYFTATWCGPCKFVEPYIKELATKHIDVDFIKIDVDRLEAVAREFEMIDVMPTCVLVKKGKEIDRVVGAKKEELRTKTEKHKAY